MPAKSEVAYAAGLFEGEGSVCLSRSYWGRQGKQARRTPQIRLAMAQVDREPLDRLASVFGGRIIGPYAGSKPNWSHKYYWYLHGLVLVQAATAAMWSWLSIRRQAQLSEALQEVRHPS